MSPRKVREPCWKVLSATFRPVTPLSQQHMGPEALRPSITTGLPFSNEYLLYSHGLQNSDILLSPQFIEDTLRFHRFYMK